MTKYIYTEKAEQEAKRLGLEERKAGTVAMFGHKPLESGMTATAWKKSGYVVEVETSRIEELETILEAVCGQHENDCNKCPKRSECEEYSHIYQEKSK